ncbi:MAG TPA: YihY/virulence factor BrkB family protein [Chthoniobacteraceae bacterium]|jgi:membrane protein
MRDWLNLLKETASCWSAHKAPKMGAALAYYTVFSLAPLVILVLSIVSIFYERDAARAQLVREASSFIGSQGAEIIDGILKQGAQNGTNRWSAVIGFLVVLFGASGAFAELQDSLNHIWGVKERTGRAFWIKIKDRLLSFSMIFVIGFLLLVSLLISAAIAAADKYMSGVLPGADMIWQVGNIIIPLAITTILFATIFKVLPDVRIAWRDVWVGGFLTATLFTVGKLLLGFYLGRSAIGSSFGAAGSLIVVLAWVYYSSQILFFGAEFTRVYAERHGTHHGKRREE